MSVSKITAKPLKLDEKIIFEQLKEQLQNIKKFPSEKTLRCQAFQVDKSALTPFISSTNKEQLLLECVKKYEIFFKENYDDRKLLLYPKNEAGVSKFICSFIRPTKVSYIDLFDYIECVRFISNFLTYEELDQPKLFPEIIVSPYNSVKWQIGDSADIAVLASSILLGVGYDVFVVMGEANHEITKKNENNVNCFFLSNDDFELDLDSKENEQNGEKDVNFKTKTEDKKQEFNNTSRQNRLVQKTSGFGKTGMSNCNGTEKGTNGANFCNFDLTRQQDEYTEENMFDQYNQVKSSEENPYYKPVVTNEEKKYEDTIFSSKSENVRRKSDIRQISENWCNEDIFYRNPNKYDFKTHYEKQFKRFLKDDEPMRLQVSAIDFYNLNNENESKKAKTTVPSQKINNPQPGLHFWLLIRASGMHEIKKSVFIDPVSGRIWDTDSRILPFYSIFQIFNHKNCWINLNKESSLNKINFDNFDNYKNDDFEYVLNEETGDAENWNIKVEEDDTETLTNKQTNISKRLSARRTILMQTDDIESEVANTMKLLESKSMFKTGGFEQIDAIKTTGKKDIQAAKLNLTVQNQNIVANKQPMKTFAERIIKLEELFQRPASWVPKFDIKKDRFLARFAKNRQKKFYQKCQVDYFSRQMQVDGLTKRIQIFMDHPRLLLKEVRSYYFDRADKLRVKREFPFEFKTIENFDSFGSLSQNNPQMNVPHWREIVTFIGRKIIFKFYPLRFHDGLIEREEIIGEKTIERFVNRDDRLVYSSVRFQKISLQSNLKDSYNYEDRHIGSVQILKMSQKYEKSLKIEGNKQIAKVVIDLERNNIKIIYHLDNQQIAPKIVETSRESFTGIISRADKKSLNLQNNHSKIQFLYSLEKDCFSKIKVAENMVVNDIKNFKNSSDDLMSKTETNVNVNVNQVVNMEEKYTSKNKINSMIDSNFDGKMQNNDDKNEAFDLVPEDRVEVELKNRGLLGQIVDQNSAEEIKQKILSEVEDRFIQRADIINRRFEEEKAKVKGLQKRIQKKNFEAPINPEEEKTFEEELYHFNLKIAILEQRLFNFQKLAFEKYAEVQNQLNRDPRLNNCH